MGEVKWLVEGLVEPSPFQVREISLQGLTLVYKEFEASTKIPVFT